MKTRQNALTVSGLALCLFAAGSALLIGGCDCEFRSESCGSGGVYDDCCGEDDWDDWDDEGDWWTEIMWDETWILANIFDGQTAVDPDIAALFIDLVNCGEAF